MQRLRRPRDLYRREEVEREAQLMRRDDELAEQIHEAICSL